MKFIISSAGDDIVSG